MRGSSAAQSVVWLPDQDFPSAADRPLAENPDHETRPETLDFGGAARQADPAPQDFTRTGVHAYCRSFRSFS